MFEDWQERPMIPPHPLEDMCDRAEHDGERFTITKDGKPVAVLMGHDDWQALHAAIGDPERSKRPPPPP
jgi:prevent-host-death family protein